MPKLWPPATAIARPPCMLRLVASSAGCGTAAPASVIRSTGLRPLSGSASMRSFSITEPMPGLRVSTSGAAAWTATVSEIWPSESVTLISGLALTVRTMPVCWNDRKPESMASSRYGPTGRLESTNSTLASVTAARRKPVSV
jgi:hypothetical protein